LHYRLADIGEPSLARIKADAASSQDFKVSTAPRFAEKLNDVIGLYLDPPEKALVFSVDEQSPKQALDRTQPGLPLKPGKAGTMTHDDKRHGTTTLFDALNVHDGIVIGECLPLPPPR
jgi:hypothetical protein